MEAVVELRSSRKAGETRWKTHTNSTMAINPFSQPFTPMSLAAWAVSGVAAYFLIFRQPTQRHEKAQPFSDAQRDAWNKGMKK